ncbi:MAG: hypothetical protein ACI37Z_03635 [Candidatus Gastranaerophilaceae bacterium]
MRLHYQIPFTTDINTVNVIVNSYLNAAGFKLTNKKGDTYYRSGDAMTGYRGFKYWINGQILLIQAWIDGDFAEVQLEGNLNVVATNYKESLSKLFQAVTNAGYNQSNINPSGQAMAQEFAQSIQNDVNKNRETMCEVGFWVSIVGVLISIFGITYGVTIYLLDFCFAAQGLKTRKKGKAITTIVLSIISILIIILQLIFKYTV